MGGVNGLLDPEKKGRGIRIGLDSQAHIEGGILIRRQRAT